MASRFANGDRTPRIGNPKPYVVRVRRDRPDWEGHFHKTFYYERCPYRFEYLEAALEKARYLAAKWGKQRVEVAYGYDKMPEAILAGRYLLSNSAKQTFPSPSQLLITFKPKGWK